MKEEYMSGLVIFLIPIVVLAAFALTFYVAYKAGASRIVRKLWEFEFLDINSGQSLEKLAELLHEAYQDSISLQQRQMTKGYFTTEEDERIPRIVERRKKIFWEAVDIALRVNIFTVKPESYKEFLK